MNDRTLLNLALVNHLITLVEKYPYMRFGQILVNYGFVEVREDLNWANEFYTESSKVLERVNKRMKNDDLD